MNTQSKIESRKAGSIIKLESFREDCSNVGETIFDIYDAMGGKKSFMVPQDVHGSWNINTNNWTPGIYIIRMEADGKALQIQRMVVVSR